MDRADLSAAAKRLCRPGYGLLASDESSSTMGRRLEKAGLDGSSLETRRAYRELFYCADLGSCISGAIMFKEMLVENDSDSRPFTACLTSQGVLPGVKVDEGLEVISTGASREETHTKGLDRLEQACTEYRKQGVKFAKWRAALKVGHDLPSQTAIAVNAAELAKYACICQESGLVPIVEPEILIDGDHDIEASAAAAELVLTACFEALHKEGAYLQGLLLKPQMIIPGSDCTGPKPNGWAIAEYTLRVMRKCVPVEVPGIMFLSGGQTEVEATANLDAINRLAREQGGAPWALSFSYGRALQASVLEIWSKDQSRVAQCKQMAAALAAANGSASQGEWNGTHPSLLDSSQSLRENFRGWNA
ncbi:hypothetical protein WJX74_000580 [Apatococcus lobatus]|uniref:fructose-bisphosphate aldolase n=1 Tax=Apatococcus lobatus TaxID=904363 RepID=A0AAW1R3Q0_9CHLO